MHARRKLVDTVEQLLAIQSPDYVRLSRGLTLSHDPSKRDEHNRIAITLSRTNAKPSDEEIKVVTANIRDACARHNLAVVNVAVERGSAGKFTKFARIWFDTMKQLKLGGLTQ
jgi:hypothetical protein